MREEDPITSPRGVVDGEAWMQGRTVAIDRGNGRTEEPAQSNALAQTLPAVQQPVHAPMPKCNVDINLGPMGSIQAWYHRVVISPTCITLVYRTDYKGGYMYRPPIVDAMQLTIHGEQYSVSSLGVETELRDEQLWLISLLRVDHLSAVVGRLRGHEVDPELEQMAEVEEL